MLKISEFLGVDANSFVAESDGEIDGFFKNPTFLAAMSEANYDLGKERRAKELALAAESQSRFSSRANVFAEVARSTLKDAIAVCEAIRDADPGSPIEILDKPHVARVAVALVELLGDIGKIRDDALILRQFAESSPAMLELLRSK